MTITPASHCKLAASQLSSTLSAELFSQKEHPSKIAQTFVGHDRAKEALNFGLSMSAVGFNVFAMGEHGTGRQTLIKQLLTDLAKKQITPVEWCYINNFDENHAPYKLYVNPGDGKQLLSRMNKFIDELMDLINEMSVQLTGLKGILGSTIAFTLKQPKRRKIIARINTHGKKLAAVSRNKYINLLPSWSPKGDAIVYTTLSRRGTAIMFNDCLKVVGCKYRPVKLLSSNISAAGISKNILSVSGGTWFSNGHKLIVTLSRKGNSDLYEFDRLKRKVIRMTTHRAIDTVPDLSPDNQHLIFVSDRSGHEQIYYLKLGTKISFQLTFGRGSSSDPVWSPDGTLIAFSKISSGHSQIHLMDPFTGEDNFLTRGRFNSEQPSWSPDGRQIVFVSSSTGVDKLYIMFIDGTGRRRLTRTPRDFEEGGPSWTARKF